MGKCECCGREETTPYDPEYGDDRLCKCGHPYYRHFDTYDGMRHVGCKYCACFDFFEEDTDAD